MRILIAGALAICVSLPASAHPSVGIVINRNGDVFYSDLERVWRVTAAGQKQIVVPNVHTHELSIDSSGAIYGEDSRWLGGDQYRHRVWKRAADGRVTDVIPWTDGFWREYGFARDGREAMYWVRCTAARVCTVRQRERTGQARNFVREGRFSGPINWIVASPDGAVYVIDGPDLRRVSPQGKLETLARISSRADGRHQLMGMTLDSSGNIYVAGHADRKVFRVTPAGRVQAVARSAAPWAPTAVALSGRGDLWMLEWAGNQARVRRVPARQ